MKSTNSWLIAHRSTSKGTFASASTTISTSLPRPAIFGIPGSNKNRWTNVVNGDGWSLDQGGPKTWILLWRKNKRRKDLSPFKKRSCKRESWGWEFDFQGKFLRFSGGVSLENTCHFFWGVFKSSSNSRFLTPRVTFVRSWKSRILEN